MSATADGTAVATLEVRAGTLAADRAAAAPSGAVCQIHVVAHERDGALILEALRVTRPGDPFTPEEMGTLRHAEAFQAAANPRAAAERLTALLAQRPFAKSDRIDLLRRLAQAHIEDRAPERARKALDEILALVPGDAAATAAVARLDEHPPHGDAVSGREGARPPVPPAPLAPPAGDGAQQPAKTAEKPAVTPPAPPRVDDVPPVPEDEPVPPPPVRLSDPR